MTAGKLLNLYNNYLFEMTGLLRRMSYDVNTDTRFKISQFRQSVEIQLEIPLYFRDWPDRNNSSERLDIVVDLKETISLPEGRCIGSAVCVNYYRVVKLDVAVAIESIRYDCLIPPAPRHAICHVHCDNKLIENRPERFARERKTITNDITNRCHTMRIPSAYVNLPGLFAIIASDHMAPSPWEEFMRKLFTKHREFPSIAHGCLDGITREGLYAWAWYEV